MEGWVVEDFVVIYLQNQEITAISSQKHTADESPGVGHASPGLFSPSAWPVTLCRELLTRMHQGLDPALEVEYAHSLRNVAALFRLRPMEKWSLFAGSAASTHYLAELESFLLERYEVSMSFSCEVHAENDVDKQKFLQAQHNTPVLVSDVAELGKSVVANLNGSSPGDTTILRQPDFNDCGIPCILRTPLAGASAKKNIDCVQEEREATGLGFLIARRAGLVHQPSATIMECVEGLAFHSPGKEHSDAGWMCEQNRKTCH